jgi:hypothetical protein
LTGIRGKSMETCKHYEAGKSGVDGFIGFNAVLQALASLSIVSLKQRTKVVGYGTIRLVVYNKPQHVKQGILHD